MSHALVPLRTVLYTTPLCKLLIGFAKTFMSNSLSHPSYTTPESSVSCHVCCDVTSVWTIQQGVVDPTSSQVFQKFFLHTTVPGLLAALELSRGSAAVFIYLRLFLTLVGLVWHHWADSLSYEYCEPIAWVWNCLLLASHKNLNTKCSASWWWSCLV